MGITDIWGEIVGTIQDVFIDPIWEILRPLRTAFSGLVNNLETGWDEMAGTAYTFSRTIYTKTKQYANGVLGSAETYADAAVSTALSPIETGLTAVQQDIEDLFEDAPLNLADLLGMLTDPVKVMTEMIELASSFVDSTIDLDDEHRQMLKEMREWEY